MCITKWKEANLKRWHNEFWLCDILKRQNYGDSKKWLWDRSAVNALLCEDDTFGKFQVEHTGAQDPTLDEVEGRLQCGDLVGDS